MFDIIEAEAGKIINQVMNECDFKVLIYFYGNIIPSSFVYKKTIKQLLYNLINEKKIIVSLINKIIISS